VNKCLIIPVYTVSRCKTGRNLLTHHALRIQIIPSTSSAIISSGSERIKPYIITFHSTSLQSRPAGHHTGRIHGFPEQSRAAPLLPPPSTIFILPSPPLHGSPPSLHPSIPLVLAHPPPPPPHQGGDTRGGSTVAAQPRRPRTRRAINSEPAGRSNFVRK
jgi:hypothetical protein